MRYDQNFGFLRGELEQAWPGQDLQNSRNVHNQPDASAKDDMLRCCWKPIFLFSCAYLPFSPTGNIAREGGAVESISTRGPWMKEKMYAIRAESEEAIGIQRFGRSCGWPTQMVKCRKHFGNLLIFLLCPRFGCGNCGRGLVRVSGRDWNLLA